MFPVDPQKSAHRRKCLHPYHLCLEKSQKSMWQDYTCKLCCASLDIQDFSDMKGTLSKCAVWYLQLPAHAKHSINPGKIQAWMRRCPWNLTFSWRAAGLRVFKKKIESMKLGKKKNVVEHREGIEEKIIRDEFAQNIT